MKAVRLYGIKDLRVEDVPVPAVEESEVLVKVAAVGVCGSDIPRVMSTGAHNLPVTIGHEFAGEIAELGKNVAGWAIGEKVTAAPLIPCHACHWCLSGEYQLCNDYDYLGSRCDGALAEYVRVPASNLVPLPKELGLAEGATADPAATALHGIWRSGVKVGSTVAIFGVGPIGFFALQWARIMGAKEMIAVDIFEEKLALAQELGATHVVNALTEDPVARIQELTNGELAHLTIETAALARTQIQAIESTRKQGSMILIGISHDKLNLPAKVVDQIMRKELAVKGSWNSNSSPFPGDEWKLSVDYMAKGSLKASPLISHRFSIEEAPKVFAMLYERKIAFNKVMFILS